MNNTQSTSTNSTVEFKLPDLGEGMHEAEIRHWRVQIGDTLKLDQPMVEVETDKAVVEIPSPISGRVADIRVQDGQVAKVGDVLVILETPSSNATSTSPIKTEDTTPPVAPIAEQTSAPPAQPAQSPQPPAARPRVLAAPAVRKLAFELGIDLEQVTPSNPNGRVSIEDVRAYAEHSKQAEGRGLGQSQASPLHLPAEPKEAEIPVQAEGRGPASPLHLPAEERQPLTGLRKRIAEHMERSWRTIPHATAFDEVDGTELIALRQALKPVAEQRGLRLTYIPLLIKLLLPLLKEFPIFNASLDEERREIIYKRYYHIGIAANSPEGLLVPVLRNADKLPLATIASELERLIEGARKRTLPLPEVSGSTFTLNNIGSFGGGSGTPIINYPEVGILAVGRLQEKPIVQNGTVIIRPMMPLALSFDHRVIDGAMAGAFLQRFRELVENPQQLMLDMV